MNTFAITNVHICPNHLQAMYKTPAKFQKDRNENIVGGVALTKYVSPLITSEIGQTSKLYM